MKYPNQRYGNPAEFAAEVRGRPAASVAKELRRSERSVRDWLSGESKVPWWVPELLRLRRYERWMTARQMGITVPIGVVSARGHVIPFKRPVKPLPAATIAPDIDHNQLQG